MAESSTTTVDAESRPADQSPPTNGLKRRQSEVSEQESKRPRVSPGKKSSEDSRTADARKDGNEAGKGDSPQSARRPSEQGQGGHELLRKKPGVVDEKQRSRRLFGGLLGSLNQPSDRTSKRRQEIESRRKAELQRQDDERLEDKQRRLEQLAERRKSVKRKMDDDTMRARHEEVLSRAHHLRTKTEPKLFYKPWDMRPEEEDCVDEQVRIAKKRIDDELAEFELSYPRDEGTKSNQEGGGPSDTSLHEYANVDGAAETKLDAERNGARSNTAPGENAGTGRAASEPVEEKQELENVTLPDAAKDEPPSLEASKANENAAEQEPAEKDTTEHDDEHVVEGEEDTVIY